MAFLTGLIAQQGGAAQQKVQNYQDAVAQEGKLDALNRQQKEWDRQQANGERDFQRLQAGDAYQKTRDAKTDAAQDLADGKGLVVPPNLLPKNHGVPLTPKQKAANAYTIASWYNSKGAFNKGDQYERQGRDFEAMESSDEKNALGNRKETDLASYRSARLAETMQMFTSKQAQQASQYAQSLAKSVSQFAASYQQRGEIANLNAQDRLDIAKLAGAIRVNTHNDDDAVRMAIAQWQIQGREYDSQIRALNPAISGAAVAPTFAGAPTGYPGLTINVNPNQMGGAGGVSTVPNANGSATIPPDPNAGGGGAGNNQVKKTSGIGNVYRKPDPVVEDAVNHAVEALDGAKNGDPRAKGVTMQSLPALLKKNQSKMGLTDAQIMQVIEAVASRTGQNQPLPPGGMKQVLSPAGSPGGAAPGSPFLPTP